MTYMLKHPRAALTIIAVLLLLPGPLLLKVRLDNAPEMYFPQSSPAVAFDRSVREHFPQDQVLLALFTGPEIYNATFLSSLHELTERLEGSPLVERAISVTTVDHIRATPDGFAVESLLGPGHVTNDVDTNRARVLEDAFAPGALASADGQSMALIVRPAPLNGSLQRLTLNNLLETGIGDAGLDSNLTAIAGHVALDVAQLKAMLQDLALLIPGTLGIALLLLWLMFRRWLVLGVSIVAITSVTGTAIALLVTMAMPFTLITAIMPPLLTALTAAMVMHLFNAICNADANGLRGEARMRSALRTITKPVLFTALTTACGLISLVASPIRPIATFGLISAVGVLVAAGLTVAVLPPIILKFDRHPWVRQRQNFSRIDRFTTRLLRISLRRPTWVVASATALLVTCGALIPRIVVETDLYAFFKSTHPINQATGAVERQLTGVIPLEVVFTSKQVDDLKDTARLEAIDGVAQWLEARPEVDHTIAMPELIAEMHAAFEGRQDLPARPLPDSAPLIEQYLLFYNGRELSDVVEPSFTRTRILVSLNVHGATALNALLLDLHLHLEANPPADLTWNTAGMGRLFAEQERLLIRGQVNSLYLVAGLITGLMLLLWRSVRMTAVSLAPNFAPVIFIFGFMGLFGIWLDMATAMVASVAIGIAIDDTIHLLHGYREQRTRGRNEVTAIARSIRHRGRALVATSIVLAAQFLLMALSPFQPTAIFGALTALGLVVALFFDLLVLPSLIILSTPAHRSRRQETLQ